jgi:hypothetical protein
MRCWNLLATKLETNNVGENREVLKSFKAVAVDPYQEARCLGRTFLDAFLGIKRRIEDQPTYRMKTAIWRDFTAQFCNLFPDDILMNLENLIEWGEEE